MEKACRANRYHYNPRLRNFARENRKGFTKSEAYMWKFVLRKRSLGYSFYRQRPILNYIADFMCAPLMMVIEVDGITHLFHDVAKKDVTRQHELEAIGFKVIRFSALDVLDKIDRVRLEMKGQVEVRERELGITLQGPVDIRS